AAEVEAWFAQARAADAAEDAVPGGGDRGGDRPAGGTGPGPLAPPGGKIVRRQQGEGEPGREGPGPPAQAAGGGGGGEGPRGRGGPASRRLRCGKRLPRPPGWRATRPAPRRRPPPAAASAPTGGSRWQRTARWWSAGSGPPPRRPSRPWTRPAPGRPGRARR